MADVNAWQNLIGVRDDAATVVRKPASDNIMNPRPREACCFPLHTQELLLLFSGPFLVCERIHGNHSVCSNHRCQVQNVNILLKLSSDFYPTSNFFTLSI